MQSSLKGGKLSSGNFEPASSFKLNSLIFSMALSKSVLPSKTLYSETGKKVFSALQPGCCSSWTIAKFLFDRARANASIPWLLRMVRSAFLLNSSVTHCYEPSWAARMSAVSPMCSCASMLTPLSSKYFRAGRLFM